MVVISVSQKVVVEFGCEFFKLRSRSNCF